MKMVFCVVEIWVDLILASEGDHEGRPYRTDFVGATLVVALASNPNGTETK
jgi:hypothetical protein